MEHKKFMDIENFKVGIGEGFQPGDHIVISEKIDGANAAIRYDPTTNTIIAQSRKKILDPINNLRGFYEYSQTLDVAKVAEILSDNLIVFGEFLMKHSVDYPDERYNHFYVFDVYDTKTQSYLPQEVMLKIADELGLETAPIFYEGEFISWEHCMSFVGRTDLGGEYGEGIVCKNMTKLNNPNCRTPFYIKIVGEKFRETKGSHPKEVDPDKLKAYEDNKALCETIVTEARVRKLLHKFVDEGILPEDWGARDMKIVAQNLGRAVYEDCLKEEPETVKQIIDFGKTANGIAMKIARTFI